MTQKYRISEHGYRCIGPCYEAGKLFVHPLTLEAMIAEKPVCPISLPNPDAEGQYADGCDKPDKLIDDEKMKLFMLFPEAPFSDKLFLKFNYEITSFNSALEWINNNLSNPFENNKRILDSAWRGYYDDVNEFDQALIKIYLHFIKIKWIDYFYKISKKTKTKKELLGIMDNSFVQLTLTKFLKRKQKDVSSVDSCSDDIRDLMANNIKKLLKA